MTGKRFVKTSRTLFAALSLVSVLLTTGVAAQNRDAAATVRSFYKFHGARSGIFDASEMKAYRRWFSDDLNALLQTELRREKEYLKNNPTDKPNFGDGLPFAPLEECSRDGKYAANTFQIGAAAVENEKATVEIRFFQPKVCGGELIDAYQIELIKSRGRWLIADWIYPDAKTLTEDLKRAEY